MEARAWLVVVLAVMTLLTFSLNYLYVRGLHRGFVDRVLVFIRVKIIGIAPVRRRVPVMANQYTLRRVNRLTIHHQKRLHLAGPSPVKQARTTEQPNQQPIEQAPEVRDIMKYQPLDDAQIEAVEVLIGLGWSTNKIYNIFKGTTQKRKAEIQAVRERINLREEKQREAVHLERIRNMPRDPKLEKMTSLPEWVQQEAATAGA